MKNKTKKSYEAHADKISHEVLIRELGNLKSELARTLTKRRLARWVEVDPVPRRVITAGTVWGSIRWLKSLGKPLTPVMASAFDIEHSIWETVETPITDGPKWRVLVPTTAPSKWDGPDGKDYYQVSFISDMSKHGLSEIRVSFAANVRWTRPSLFTERGFLRIQPEAKEFGNRQEPIVLEPFKVVR